jgi:polysaccharide pyruvyl transferase WcaK-like protein
MKRKIAFYGLFGQQNWGNECTLQAILYNARRYVPDAEFACICTGPADTAARHHIPTFPISRRYANGYPPEAGKRRHRLIRAFRTVLIVIPLEILDWVRGFRFLRTFDMLVVPGTGLLTDFSSNPLGIPYYLFKWTVIAKLCRCKLLFVSVGAGPTYHPATRWLVRRTLALADYRSYRDSYSKEFLQGIGFDTRNDPTYPDLAFSLPKAIFPDGNHNERHTTVVGVGVKDYQGLLGLPDHGGTTKYRDFIEKLSTLVAWLLEHEYCVRLLIGDTLYDNRVKQDVITILRERRVATNRRLINEPISSSEDVLAQLAATDIVVSARFHNVLLALMLDKPAISLSYHEKFAALVAGVGLPECCHDIDRLDVRTVTAQIVDLEKRADDLRPQIHRKVEEYRVSLDEQYARIFKFSRGTL